MADDKKPSMLLALLDKGKKGDEDEATESDRGDDEGSSDEAFNEAADDLRKAIADESSDAFRDALRRAIYACHEED